MTDFINKVLSIVLIIVLGLVLPLNMIGLSNRNTYKLRALNEVQIFIDTVCDKGYIQNSDLDDLSRKLASTGLILEYEVEEYRIIADEDRVIMAKTCEINYERIDANGGTYAIDQGNVIRVNFWEDYQSPESKLFSRIVGGVDIFNETLASLRR